MTVGDGLDEVRRDVDEVVVLDYGGQYSQLIARRVRECGVFSELLPHHVGAAEVARRRPKGVILSGGPASVYADGRAAARARAARARDPGARASATGCSCWRSRSAGRVQGAEVGEFGRSQLSVGVSGRLLADTPEEQTCWMSHRDTVFEAPPGFTALASSTASPVAAFESPERQIYGIQFHPEVVHTPYGQQVLQNFLIDICRCDGSWSISSVIEEQVRRIRAQVGPTVARSAGCRAASTRPSRRCSCTRRSATG